MVIHYTQRISLHIKDNKNIDPECWRFFLAKKHYHFTMEHMLKAGLKPHSILQLPGQIVIVPSG